MRKIVALILCLFVCNARAADISNLSGAQLPGTTTNDNAAAGNVGQYLASNCVGNTNTATVTISIAAPGVITWTAHPFANSPVNIDTCPVVFTTTGALPTGITAGTTYWVVPSSITTNTFQIATTVANALAGTSVTTTGTQSGTQTATASVSLANSTAANITGLSLPAGDWDVSGMCAEAPNGATTSTSFVCNVTTTSAALNTTPADNIGVAFNDGSTGAGLQNLLPTSIGRFSLSGTTTVFLVTQSTFAVNTMNAYGTLRARRVR